MRKKLTVNSLAVGNLKMRRKQYTILIIGIILAMVFSSGTLFFISCMKSSKKELQYKRQGKQQYIIINAQTMDFEPAVSSGMLDGNIGYISVLSYAWQSDGKYEKGTTIGKLDMRAKELYYQQLVSGTFPEKPGEIAVEKSALKRMDIEAEPGDKITFVTKPCDGENYLEDTVQKVYTLTGILADRKTYFESLYSDELERISAIPAAFVCESEQIQLGGKENLIALFNESSAKDIVSEEESMTSLLHFAENSYKVISTDYLHSISVGDVYTRVENSTTAFAFLSVLLAFASCFAIANTFNNNLRQRKSQIGMLRAVGATKRQIVNIFSREALIISLICTPVSTALSYFSVKLAAYLMGENFVFVPNMAILAFGALLGVACVMLAAVIPIVGVSRLSPLQAIRDIEMMRKMKNKKLHSKTQFDVPRLLAKRSLTFSKARTICVSTLLAATTLISCCAVMLLNDIKKSNTHVKEYYESDYAVTNYYQSCGNTFINSTGDSIINENGRQECLSLPDVSKVLGTKSGYVNLLIDGEYPKYLELNEYQYYETSTRYVSVFDECPEIPSVTKENLYDLMHVSENTDYTYSKIAAGYTQDVFNTSILAESSEVIGKYKDDLIDGEINPDKLNSGEEIIICAPEKIGYFFHAQSESGYSAGILDLTAELPKKNRSYYAQERNYVLDTAESCFKVGDTVTLSFLSEDVSGNVKRIDKQVKIGAITGKDYFNNHCSFYTTLEGLDALGFKIDYYRLDISLKDECTAEIDETVQSSLSSIFPGKSIDSAFVVNEGLKANYSTALLSVVAIIVIFSCICIALVNNSVTAQIRAGKRAIGTLRAVGASQKDFRLSYFLQVASMSAWGFGIGVGLYALIYLVMYIVMEDLSMPFVIWPALPTVAVLAVVCLVNISARIKEVTGHSIVENIREL